MKNYLFLLLLLIAGCSGKDSLKNQDPVVITPVINYTVKTSFPHDTNSFTEGFAFHKGQLFESTGSPESLPNTASIIGQLDLKSGEIQEKVKLDKSIYFGEGIAFLKNKAFQLTYKNQICFVYDDATFEKLGQYKYNNVEGWGLTSDEQYLIMSDGSATLSYIDPVNFNIVKKISVSENGYAVQFLNELEYIQGHIYANIWQKDEIVKIDPSNGNVVGKLDLSDLKRRAVQIHAGSQETNGIAYDPVSKKILVTGKMWPKIFEIEFK